MRQGVKMGGGGGRAVARHLLSAARTIPRHAVAVSGISFLTPYAVHHSARRESVERNLLRGDVACHGVPGSED